MKSKRDSERLAMSILMEWGPWEANLHEGGGPSWRTIHPDEMRSQVLEPDLVRGTHLSDNGMKSDIPISLCI